MKNIYLISSLLILLTACGGGASSPNLVTPIPLAPEQIVLAGAGSLGIFDPSVVKAPDSNRLWMSYSSVSQSSYYAMDVYWGVSIRLAFSDDNGTTWQDAAIELAANSENIVGPMMEDNPAGNILEGSQGIWQSETSSLIYDAAAPLAQRWKLVWHQYLNANLTSFFVDHGWIALRMAATPLGLSSATTIKLFGGAGLKPDGSNTGSPVFSPVGGAPEIQLNNGLSKSLGADLKELNFCIFVEPGLHATATALYLSMYCADASSVPSTSKVTPYIVYFRCTNPCSITDALSWEYLGRLLSPADAQNATDDQFYQAPSIVEHQGKTYLLVTPVNDTAGNARYNGCRVYEFVDVNSNQLVRNNGTLVEIARVDGQSNTHNGACEMLSGLEGGILLSQFAGKGGLDSFKIIKSQLSLP